MDTCKFVESEKGKKKLIDRENYVYHNHKENANGARIYWRCENQSCRARLHTDDSYCVLKCIGNHNHSMTAAQVSAKVAIANIKEKAISSRTPHSVITEELVKLNECTLAEVTKLTHISRNVRRWRGVEANHPPIPPTNIGFSIITSVFQS